MNYSQGSLWHKWDLHVHTPCSIVQHYGGDNDESWENFIKDLESLPPEFKVVGINDYIFLDGYKKVMEYKNDDRLQNIDLFLPVIELRLGMFVGTDESWQRLNFHIIFSDKISDDTCFTIESQFLSDISGAYTLSPEVNHLHWSAKPTPDSLIELGKMIKSSVPAGELHNYKSDLEEGFNALNFDYQKILDKLRVNHYFIGKHFTALGKTEWDQLKWKKNSIATKKSVINEVDFVFTAAESVSKWKSAKQSLIDNGVKSRLLDCSDAHYLSSSTNKDRIGNCFTWIKADTTFEGLRQTLYEDERIFIGEIPAKEKEVNLNPNRFIKSLSINKKGDSTLSEKWFSSHLEFNPSMIAIIGNKGAGKSALIDILGLLGNSHVDANSRPFLSRDKFGVKGKWSNFESTLKWHSDVEVTKSLDEEIDLLSDEFVRYIPQNFFEEICNELQDNNERGLFTEELYKVIYSHIPPNDRLGEATLQGLIDQKTRAINNAIEDYQSELRRINFATLELEKKVSPKQISLLQSKINDKESTLTAIKQNKPTEIHRPEANNETKSVLVELDDIAQDKEGKKGHLSELNRNLSSLKVQESDARNFLQRIESFREQHVGLLEDLAEQYTGLINANNLHLEKIISLEINIKEVMSIEENIRKEIAQKDRESIEIRGSIEQIELREAQLRESLAEEEKKFHQYTIALNEWEEKVDEITGDEKTPDTLLYLKKELEEIANS